jgi:hypothetical protein
VLPVRTHLNFKHINVLAAKGKIAQFNDELKSSAVSQSEPHWETFLG